MKTFVTEFSEKFNGGAADTVTLYDAAKFTSELHKAFVESLLEVIARMEDKDFYNHIIVDEIKKRLNKQL